jgi:hypothetical protein
MAGPSIAARVTADTTPAAKALGDVADKGASAASKLHSAFGDALGALNQSGVLGPFGDALEGVNKAIGVIVEHAHEIGPAMLGVGTAVAGIGAGLTALGSKDQAAHSQLQAAVQATGKDYDDYADQVDAAIKKQENFGHSASDTQNALQVLTQATGDPTKALQYLGTASDLAAAKHESLGTAATQLGKAYNGSTKLLKEFGDTGEKAVDTTSKVEAATKAATTADEAADKAKQHLADVHAELAGKTTLTTAQTIELRDAQQKVTDTSAKAADAHKKLADTQSIVVNKTEAASDNMDVLTNKLKGQASAAADTFTGKLDAMKTRFEDSAAQLGQKYGPALTAVGSGLAGVGAAIQVVTALHLASVAGWLADAAAAAAAAVAENLALLGIPVLIAAVVAGIAWMVTHWQQVKDAVMDAYNWIVANWPYLLGVLTGPFGLAAALIYKHWSDVKGWAQDAFNFIVGVWNGLVGFFTGLPGRMAGIFDHMWDGIGSAFKGAINEVIRAWNSLKFTTPHVKVFGVDTPSVTIGVPQIPTLAQGGLMTSDGLVYAHAGEVISPAPPGAGRGLHIENATFNSAVDVDMLSKRLEFAINAGVHV